MVVFGKVLNDFRPSFAGKLRAQTQFSAAFGQSQAVQTRFQVGHSQRPAPAGHATRARRSHDPRPQVTRPAGADRWLYAEAKRGQALENQHFLEAEPIIGLR